MIIFISILVLSFVAFAIHLCISKRHVNARRIVELLLLYQLVFNIGILGFLSFIGLTFLPKVAAAYNAWPTCPYQQELGNVNLAFGVLGILSIWFREHFWTATVIGASIWLFGDGIHHLVDSTFSSNFSEGNTGILLYSDLGIPLVLITLLFFYHKFRAHH